MPARSEPVFVDLTTRHVRSLSSDYPHDPRVTLEETCDCEPATGLETFWPSPILEPTNLCVSAPLQLDFLCLISAVRYIPTSLESVELPERLSGYRIIGFPL